MTVDRLMSSFATNHFLFTLALIERRVGLPRPKNAYGQSDHPDDVSLHMSDILITRNVSSGHSKTYGLHYKATGDDLSIDCV